MFLTWWLVQQPKRGRAEQGHLTAWRWVRHSTPADFTCRLASSVASQPLPLRVGEEEPTRQACCSFLTGKLLRTILELEVQMLANLAVFTLILSFPCTLGDDTAWRTAQWSEAFSLQKSFPFQGKQSVSFCHIPFICCAINWLDKGPLRVPIYHPKSVDNVYFLSPHSILRFNRRFKTYEVRPVLKEESLFQRLSTRTDNTMATGIYNPQRDEVSSWWQKDAILQTEAGILNFSFHLFKLFDSIWSTSLIWISPQFQISVTLYNCMNLQLTAVGYFIKWECKPSRWSVWSLWIAIAYRKKRNKSYWRGKGRIREG